MYDLFGTSIIMKAFSHQLDKDFEVTLAGQNPQPNYFVASADQIVDNAAEQTYQLTKYAILLFWHVVASPLKGT